MQNLPDRNVLLQAVAGFLAQDVVPAVDDRAVAFRVRIAAHLVATVARELMGEEQADLDQTMRLAHALDSTVPIGLETRDERHHVLRGLEATLLEQVKAADPDSDRAAAFRRLLRAELRARLAVVNPQFDLSGDIERPGL